MFDRDDWMDAARANAEFLVRELRRADGRLLRSWQDGRAHLLGYAEDHAALLEALLTLAEVDEVRWLDEARRVADDLVRLFADDEGGGFLHDRHRRRRAHRAAQGLRGQRNAVGELTRRARAAPPRRTHRRRLVARTRRALDRHGRPRPGRPSDRVRLPAPCRSVGSSTRRSKWRSWATPPTRRALRWSTSSATRLLPWAVRVVAEPGAGDDPDTAPRRPRPDRGARRGVRLRALRVCAPGDRRRVRSPASSTPSPPPDLHHPGFAVEKPQLRVEFDGKTGKKAELGGAGKAGQLRGMARPSARASAIAQPYAMTASPRHGSTSPMSSTATLPPAFTARVSSTGSGAPWAVSRKVRSS